VRRAGSIRRIFNGEARVDRKKKTREKTNFQKSQNEKEIHGTSILVLGKSLLFWHFDGSIQQGEAWSCCLPGASQMRFTLSKSDFGEGGALQRVNK